jgi:hypothetical protein
MKAQLIDFGSSALAVLILTAFFIGVWLGLDFTADFLVPYGVPRFASTVCFIIAILFVRKAGKE